MRRSGVPAAAVAPTPAATPAAAPVAAAAPAVATAVATADVRLQTQSEGGGWGPKTQNQATAAWFQACRAKQWWWEVLGVGGIACKEQ